MNRRLNTILFLIAATALNLILMFVYFLIMMGLAGLVLPLRTGILGQILWLLLFALAVAGAFFTYKALFGWFRRRVGMEKYFDEFLFKERGKSG